MGNRIEVKHVHTTLMGSWASGPLMYIFALIQLAQKNLVFLRKNEYQRLSFSKWNADYLNGRMRVIISFCCNLGMHIHYRKSNLLDSGSSNFFKQVLGHQYDESQEAR